MSNPPTTHSVTELIERYHADLEAVEQELAWKRKALDAKFKADIMTLMAQLQENEKNTVVIKGKDPRWKLTIQDFQP